MNNANSVLGDFYRRKRVLVTGHTGFKGSWLSLWLTQLGSRVSGFSAYLPSEPCNFEILGLRDLVEHRVGDIRDFRQINRVFMDFQPEIVFHLAAQPILRRSYDEPKLTLDTNLGGTVNVLECVRQSESVQAAVIITSDKCYKNEEWVWGYREDDQLGGDDPYSASKACAEIAVHSYCRSYFRGKGVRVASTRAGNVIGGGDWAEDRIVPDCIRAWSKGKELILRSPHATRPWQHVLEPLSGYLCLGVFLGQNRLSTGEAFNFGPPAEINQTVEGLISAMADHWPGATWGLEVPHNKSQPESTLLKLCCDKALRLLGWRAVLSFSDSVRLTAQWYRAFYEEGDGPMYDLSCEQIEHYRSKASGEGLEWAK